PRSVSPHHRRHGRHRSDRRHDELADPRPRKMARRMAQDVAAPAPEALSIRTDWHKPIQTGFRSAVSVVGLLLLWGLISAGPWSVPIPSPLASLRALARL